MPRTKSKYPVKCRKIGERFIHILENEFGTLADAATELGYVNPSTLYAIRDGRALPSHDKILQATEVFRSRRAQTIDLNWLFTGKNSADNSRQAAAISSLDNDIINKVRHLSDTQKKALKVLLGTKSN